MLANHHILIDTVAPGDHVSKVEGRIRSIKGKWQVLLHTLDYVPSKILVRGGVIVANRLVNMQRCSISLPPESPREKFPGRLTDYKRDISGIASGSHIQASVPNLNNSDATKTETCLVLAPKDNQTRSYSALNLDINEDEAEATENEEEEVELQEGRGVHQHQPFNTKSRSTLPSTNVAVQDISKNDLPVTTRKERVKHQGTLQRTALPLTPITTCPTRQYTQQTQTTLVTEVPSARLKDPMTYQSQRKEANSQSTTRPWHLPGNMCPQLPISTCSRQLPVTCLAQLPSGSTAASYKSL